MRLHAWSTVRRDIEFDPDTGSASVIKLPAARPDTSIPAGFAGFERTLLGSRQVFAIYKSGGRLFFSAGVRRSELNQPGLQFVHSHPFPLLSCFRVIESDQTVFSIVYSHVGRLLHAIIDPTYDQLDEDMDFFLAFVAEHAQSADWQANVCERWVSEPSV